MGVLAPAFLSPPNVPEVPFSARSGSLTETSSPLSSATTTEIPKESKEIIASEETNSASENEIKEESPAKKAEPGRTEQPQKSAEARYPSPQFDVATLNEHARAALVNILCETSEGTLRPTSGSGVFIDPRGIILTNAHVAQYVLLSERSDIELSCTVRTGSPAKPHWRARILFFPEAWAKEHAKDILNRRPQGTGEHDYAFLALTESVDGSPLPSSVPYLNLDAREAIVQTSDRVLIAAYPAEFVGGMTTRNNLFASSAVTSVKQLLTFTENLVDVISLGGTIVAQGGSSGGAVLNEWGYLVGLVVTTTEATTTGERDLRAITPSHITRSLRQHVGQELSEFLAQDPQQLTAKFSPQTLEIGGLFMEGIRSRSY